MEATEVRTFSSTEAMRLAGVTYRRLDYWRRTGLVTPSIHSPVGSGDQCIWSFEDVVVMRLVVVMTEAGASLQRIRMTLDYVRRYGHRVADLVFLVVTSSAVYPCLTVQQVADALIATTANQAASVVRVADARDHVLERANLVAA